MYYFVCLLLVLPTAWAASSLGHYNIKPDSLTVSGISAGGAFATQFHVAFSKNVTGIGIYAGIPYGCAKGSLSTALTCMSSPLLTTVNSLITRTTNHENAGTIDKTSNMANDYVYVFHGTQDTVVAHGNGDHIVQYYEHYITDSSHFMTVMDMAAEHCFPTDNYGTACNKLNSASYINNCNYKGAYDMLNFMYGGQLKEPTGTEAIATNVLQFDQGEFFPGLPSGSSMDTIGFVYVPEVCKDPTRLCKLHISFHGCHQGRSEIDDIYVLHTGYLDVAELNGIIVLFPQATKNIISNPNGCFDWWGYADNSYDTRNGEQMAAIMRMVERITG